MQITREFSINEKVNINAPLKDVWKALSDFDNPHLWAPGVENAYKVGTKHQEVGAKRYCKLADFGEIEEEVTDWTPMQGFTYTVSPLGPLTNAISEWKISSNGDQLSELTVNLQYDIRFSVFGKLLHKVIMRSKLESSLPPTLLALKAKIENNPNL
jgi:hypothetical protein